MEVGRRSETTLRLVIPAVDLSRLLANALAFMPARSPIKHVQITFTPDLIRSFGTDGYAAGTDSAPLTACEGLQAPFEVLVGVGDAEELERACRAAKKAVTSIIFDGENLRVQTGVGQTGETVTDEGAEDDANTIVQTPYVTRRDGIPEDVMHAFKLYDRLIELLEERLDSPPTTPNEWYVDPKLFTYVSKVKADKTDRICGVWMNVHETGAVESLLLKVGPTFYGLIMPVNKKVYGKALGADGLWTIPPELEDGQLELAA